MTKKFIPNGDLDFAQMAESFARRIGQEPAKYEVSQGDCDELTQSVRRFRAALQACNGSGRSAAATRGKEDARSDAERIIRRIGHVVRSNARISAADKICL